LSQLVEKKYQIILGQSLHDEIAAFVRDPNEFNEYDLKRVGMKEVVVFPNKKKPEERRFYCALSQTQMRICPSPTSYAVRRVNIKNAYSQSKGGCVKKHHSGLTESGKYEAAYFNICKIQNKLEKKPTREELKSNPFHQDNVVLMRAFKKPNSYEIVRKSVNKKRKRERDCAFEKELALRARKRRKVEKYISENSKTLKKEDKCALEIDLETLRSQKRRALCWPNFSSKITQKIYRQK